MSLKGIDAMIYSHPIGNEGHAPVPGRTRMSARSREGGSRECPAIPTYHPSGKLRKGS